MSKSQRELTDELLEAAEKGNLALVKKCLAKVKDGVNACDDNGNTALHQAAQEGQENIVKYLLTHGADIEQTDDDGETALDIAARNDQNAVVELLENAEYVHNIVEWSLLGSSKLVHVEASLILERKLIEVFNFESREHLTIIEKLKTGAETTLPPASFDTLPEQTLRNIFLHFTQLGGKADENFVLHARARIHKNPGNSPLTSKSGD